MRQVSIRFGKEDLQIIKELMEKKGWDRSRAIRHIIRLIGVILQRGKLSDIEEILEEELEIPDKCPECGGEFTVRAPFYRNIEGTSDELWQCKNRHLFRVAFRPIAFERLQVKVTGETELTLKPKE